METLISLKKRKNIKENSKHTVIAQQPDMSIQYMYLSFNLSCDASVTTNSQVTCLFIINLSEGPCVTQQELAYAYLRLDYHETKVKPNRLVCD